MDTRNNAASLVPDALTALPLGAIRPRGWLLRQLQIQANGQGGHLDEFWPSLDANSAWLGGTGENWERGPYFCDGLIPLAYLLEDERLIPKAQRWMNAMLDSQQADGFFGPTSNRDPWPRMVALKALTQYYEATGEARVLELMTRYFRYQTTQPTDLPHNDWRGVRYAENVLSLDWLYARTGEPWLLDLAQRQLAAGFDWTDYFTRFPWRAKIADPFQFRHEHHVVNVAMGIKTPGVQFRHSNDAAHREAIYAAIRKLDAYHGMVTGVFTGDEHLAGLSPSQGTELCAVVETMFSLEILSTILGDPSFGDRIEQIAYNALPATFTPDMWAHQYDQQVNQVLCSVAQREWTDNSNTSNIFGVEPHFGCCTANFHQGWPKLIAHLWMATPDHGLAAVAYGPSAVTANIGAQQTAVTITTETDYPFSEILQFTLDLAQPVDFPLWLRVPGWVKSGAQIQINEEAVQALATAGFHVLRRLWQAGDRIRLTLPMPVRTVTRDRNAFSLLRGPIVLALKIEETFTQIKGELPHADWAVAPKSAWNYGLRVARADPNPALTVKTQPVGTVPFDPATPPLIVTAPGRRVPAWGMINHSAAPVPASPVDSFEPLETVTLIPFGSTHLRIAEFPEVR